MRYFDLGKLQDFITDGFLFNYPAKKIWTGKISLSRNDIDDSTVDKILSEDNMKKYIVAIDKNEPTRCIDGRPKAVVDEDSGLGPKVVGATAHVALTHRIVNVEDIDDDLSFEHDISQISAQLEAIGIRIGGHIDDHAKGHNTGCGAVDNINLILEKIEKPEPRETLQKITSALVGEGFDLNIFETIVAKALHLDSLKPIYMPKEGGDPKGEFLYKQKVVDIIRSNARDKDAVPKLTGPHNEIALIVNYIKGYTIDNDRFSQDNDDKYQIFGWDIWEIYEEARRLYDYNMYESYQDQQLMVKKRMMFVITRILLGVATAMVLTDGNIRLIKIDQ